jgi:tetratricopeptide (TPR) repeat protein
METSMSCVSDTSSGKTPYGQEPTPAKVHRHDFLMGIGLVVCLLLTGVAIAIPLNLSWLHWSGTYSEDSVHDHWEQAKKASDEGDASLAIPHLEAVLTICPLNSEAQFLMARNCRRIQDPASWHYLMQAESLGWPRQQILLEKRLLQAEAGDIWEVEEALLEQLNRLTPDESVILEGVVRGYLNSARFLDARVIATTWIERYPRDWRAYFYRGRAYQGLGQINEAIADYQDAIKIHPQSLAVRLWYAEALRVNHDHENALENYQVYLKSAPDDADAMFAVAECQFSLGRPEARTTLEELLSKHPNHPGALILGARISLTEDKPEKALDRLRKVQALGIHDPEVLQVLVQTLTQLHRLDEAELVRKQHGEVLKKAKKLRELAEKIQAETDDPSLRYQAGMLALELQEDGAATGWFQSVFWIDPDYRPTHLALADYWDKHGQPQRAAYHRRRAEGKKR